MANKRSFTPAFMPGDEAWVFSYDSPRRVTVGQIRISYTGKMPGIADHAFFGHCVTNDGENYGPQEESYVEEYMCMETGIGSGTVFKLGEHIFATEQECAAANAANIERMRLERIERARSEYDTAVRNLNRLTRMANDERRNVDKLQAELDTASTGEAK